MPTEIVTRSLDMIMNGKRMNAIRDVKRAGSPVAAGSEIQLLQPIVLKPRINPSMGANLIARAAANSSLKK